MCFYGIIDVFNLNTLKEGDGMRFRFLLLAFMIVIAFNLSGCENNQNGSKESMSQGIDQPIEEMATDHEPEDKDEAEDINENLKLPKEDESVTVIYGQKDNAWTYITDEGTKLREYAIDLDGDGAEEKIQLNTAAQRDENGDILWDDSQDWLLLVEDQNAYYPLFAEPVQIGMVYFNVFYDENDLPKISLLLSAGASMRITNYYYDDALNGYKAENVYEENSINSMYSTIPYY